jgi:hypothetical protein
MTITIGNYDFHGPHFVLRGIENRAGVYAILNHKADEIELLDLGESGDLQATLQNHARLQFWQSYMPGTVGVMVHYHETDRKQIERDIRNEYEPASLNDEVASIWAPAEPLELTAAV